MTRRTRSFAVVAALNALVSCGPTQPHPDLQTRDHDSSAVRATADEDGWRSTPPAHGKLSSFVPPTPQETRLSSGMRVLVVENHEQPLIAIRWIAPIGAADVPAGKQGLAHVLAKMLAEGAGRRDAATFGRDLATLGASLDVTAGLDGIFVSAQGLVENLDATLEVVGDVLKRPRLDRATLARVRGIAVAEGRVRAADGFWASLIVAKQGFLGQAVPEGFDPVGDAEGVGKLNLGDVMAFHRAAFEPSRMTVVVVGDIAPAEVSAKLEALLAGSRGTSSGRRIREEAAATRFPPGPAHKLILVDRPDAKQVDIAVGLDGIDRTSPDWVAVQVMNHAFGGMYASRINLLLREARGYTYAFRSHLVHSRRFGQLSMRTAVRPEVAVAALDAILAEMVRFFAEPPSQEEVDRARRVLLTQAARRFSTNEEAAAAFDDIVLYGLPLDTWSRDIAALAAVTRDDVMQVARRVLVQNRLVGAMVGPVAAMSAHFAARGFQIEKRDL
jgi:zinc protease